MGESNLISAGRECDAANEGSQCNQEKSVRSPLHDGTSSLGGV